MDRPRPTPGLIPSLWFDGQAEEAARFYVGIFPDSRITGTWRAPSEGPGIAAGDVVTVSFTLMGQPFTGINGGPHFTFSEAISFTIPCSDQAETDRYWAALTADGGRESQCGWCKDRFGLSWQVVPERLTQLLADPDPGIAGRVMQKMLTMRKIEIAALEAAARGKG